MLTNKGNHNRAKDFPIYRSYVPLHEIGIGEELLSLLSGTGKYKIYYINFDFPQKYMLFKTVVNKSVLDKNNVHF